MTLFALILLFGAASYIVGLREMFAGEYAPSTFSRVVWLLLAVVSFAGVVASSSSTGSIVLAIVFLAGNTAMCIASLWKGYRGIGKLEYACLAILIISVLIWALLNSPLISLSVSLLAHFVGGVPTIKKVLLKPQDESAWFWSLFFVASLFSILASLGSLIQLIIFPIYFVIFDGSMAILSLRKRT